MTSDTASQIWNTCVKMLWTNFMGIYLFFLSQCVECKLHQTQLIWQSVRFSRSYRHWNVIFFLTPICQSLIAGGLPDFGVINKWIMNPCALSARPAFLATRLCSERRLSPWFFLYPGVVFKHLRVSCGWALLTYMTISDQMYIIVCLCAWTFNLHQLIIW